MVYALSLSLSLNSPSENHCDSLSYPPPHSLSVDKLNFHLQTLWMGYLSCNAESAIATCDPYNREWHRKYQNNLNKSSNKLFKISEFSYSDLESATNTFSADNFLGKGSHGSVYKAALQGGKLLAAVKKTTTASATSLPSTNSPTENEIEILSRVRSPRLVNLLGFGVDSNGRKLIVVEFMPNGSLYDLLHKSSKPPVWPSRVRFSLQIATAVQQLHLSNPPVIHRDIKSSNILIDGEWNARLGDFGLALRGNVEDVKVKCTPPAGTLGYLDPGYLAPGDLSTKSDVFSFGILLLEILSGRNAIDMKYSPPSVVDWARPLIRGCDYESICDPRIGQHEDPVVIRHLSVVAARCFRSKAEKWPSMSDVVECLRCIYKRVSSPIWNNVVRRVGKGVCNSSQSVKYELLDESTEIIKTLRVGIRRNTKVSNVPGVELNKDQVGRSRSVGSTREIGFGTLGSNFGGNNNHLGGPVRRRAGMAVKMPMENLNKSRSMGMLQSSKLGNNTGFVVHLVKNPNAREKEDSKLMNLEQKSPE